MIIWLNFLALNRIFFLFIYITAFSVTSAPEPAVVGTAANLKHFFAL